MSGDRSAEANAYDIALRALARKERTVAEMREWLERREVESGSIERVITQLIELRALNDREYARKFAEDRRSLAGWGRRRIAEDLRRRGIESSLIDLALAEEDLEDELERAVSLLAGRQYSLTDDRERGRALRFLSRRGFESETAYAAIRRHQAA